MDWVGVEPTTLAAFLGSILYYLSKGDSYGRRTVLFKSIHPLHSFFFCMLHSPYCQAKALRKKTSQGNKNRPDDLGFVI